MKPIQIISQDVFDKVRSRFSNLQMGDETGAVTIDPAEARFFDFDFVIEGVNLGRVSVSLNDLGSLKVYYSQGITENHDAPVKKEWFNFLREMRFFAMRRLLRFDTRDIAKTNLDKNDFKHLAATQGPKEQDMTTMNESRWNHKSTKKTSRAVAGKTEVIVRHAKPVEETYPGARSQKKNIKAIYIQNADGERFKYPFIHPAGAFAMAQHVDHGGVPHDPAGKAIIQMSEQIAQLQEFQRKIQRTSLHDDAMGITERAVGRLDELKAKMAALGKRHHYENWVMEFNEQEHMDDSIMELDAVTMEDYKSKFTQTSFQEELAGYFPLLHKIMKETSRIELEDYVSEVWDDEAGYDTDDPKHPEYAERKADQADYERKRRKEEPTDSFEEWAEAVEQGKLTDDQIEELKQELGKLPTDPNGNPLLQLGPNGQTSWQFFNQLGIDDTDLKDKLEAAAELNDETNGFEVFVLWAQKDYPELAVALGFSGTPEAQPEQPPTDEMTQPDSGGPGMATVHGMMPNENDEATMGKGMMPAEDRDPKDMIKEVAKIVKSFYNRDNPEVGPFRGNEGIAIDVKKSISEKFGEEAGEQAREIAEKFMEKLAQEWHQKHGKVEHDGLARLKELLGNVKTKVEGLDNSGKESNVDEAEWDHDPFRDGSAGDHATDPASQTAALKDFVIELWKDGNSLNYIAHAVAGNSPETSPSKEQIQKIIDDYQEQEDGGEWDDYQNDDSDYAKDHPDHPGYHSDDDWASYHDEISDMDEGKTLERILKLSGLKKIK